MSQVKPLREYLSEESKPKRYLAGLALLKQERPQLPAKSIHHQSPVEPSYPLIRKHSLHSFWEFMFIPVIMSGLLFVVNPVWAWWLSGVTATVLLFTSVFTYTGNENQQIRRLLANIVLSKKAKLAVKTYHNEHLKYFGQVAEYKKLVIEVRENLQPILNEMNSKESSFTYINDMGKLIRLESGLDPKYRTMLGTPVNYL